jgi:16S rRNA processing protein RimM
MADPDRLVLVARVSGAFGVRGEVRLASFTEDPLTLLQLRALRKADGGPGLTLVAGRTAKGGLIARAEEVASKEQADALRGLQLFAPRSTLPPAEEDEFYLTDLIGLKAETPDGAPLGVIKAAPNFGAGDLLEIQPAGGGPSWLVAFTAETAPHVDVEGGKVVIVRPSEVE